MKLVVFLNNHVAALCAEWLKSQGADIALAVLHPEPRRKFGNEIIKALDLEPSRILDASELKTPRFPEKLKAQGVQLGISIFFGYIIPPSVIQAVPSGILNLHPSFLPYNRGAYPNIWPLIDGTPAGVTLHYLDEGIDTGDIVAQDTVEVLSTDTGKILYERLEESSIVLFKRIWPEIREGKIKRMPQDPNEGSFHRTQDVKKIDQIDPEAMYKAKDLINLLRARTFPPYSGAYMEIDGKKIYLTLKLEEQNEDDAKTNQNK